MSRVVGDKRTNFVFLAVILDGWKGASSGDQRFTLAPFVDVFRLRFVESCWIA